MRVIAFLLLGACAVSSAPPAPASQAVDPIADFEPIPEGACPNAPRFDGRLSVTRAGIVALEKASNAERKDYELKITKAETSQKLAEAERKQALDELAKARWWQKYGPIVAGAAAGVTLVGGAVVGFELGRGVRYHKPTPLKWHIYRQTLRAYGH